MTIAELRAKIDRIRDEAPQEGVRIMKEEVHRHSKTGTLENSIDAAPIGTDTWSIGTSLYYATYIQNGRGPVRPVNRKALHWIEDGNVFAMRAAPVKADDFCGRTATRLRAFIHSII